MRTRRSCGCAAASGGSVELGDVCDPHAVAAFARAPRDRHRDGQRRRAAAAGVVDALLAQGTRAVGPTSAGAEIEWNKAFARSMLLAESRRRSRRCCGSCAARARSTRRSTAFGSTPVVVKPSGLTGGKGVKVMGPHLASHDDARAYALELLGAAAPASSVLIEEKIVGAEFTIQAISDGRTVVFPPSTYDYPYRFDGDQGPGTGGMGSLSIADADAAVHDAPPITSRPARSSSG